MTFPLDNDIQSINIMEFINYDIHVCICCNKWLYSIISCGLLVQNKSHSDL